MKEDTRTQQQIKAYFLFQEFIAQEMKNQNITLDKLVVEIQPAPTKDNLHEIFKAILQTMYQKTSTRGITREQLNNCLDVYMEALAKINVNIPFPEESKRTLLQFYS